ncbi:MFS transporter [Streptomyces sp. NPDC048696]|uniref:MFS transporter n=1 Tax=Streptomyces sp. NPDC048696 TaxID=3365585 RepID=UPI003710746C
MTIPKGPASLWRHRDFMLLWGGQTVSEIGSAVTVLALPLLAVVALNATPFQTGLLKAASGLAFLLVALPAGVLVDRYAKRRLMLWCDVARAAVVGLVPLLWWWGQLEMWQLYVIVAVAGVLTVFFDVAYQSYLPHLLRHDQLVDANGKMGSTQYFAYVSGTGLGGAVAAVVGVARAVAVDALSFLASAVTLALIRVPEEPPVKERAERRMRAEIAEGLSFVFRHPVLRRIVACTASSNLGISIAEAVDMIFIVRVLKVQSGYVGLLLACATVGGIVGGIVAGRIGARFGTARMIWASFACCGWTGLLVPLAQPGWQVGLYAIGWSIFSATAVVYNTGQLSFRQAVCPPELLGRMNASVRWLIWGINPLGALLGGALGTWIGIRPTLWIAMACVWSSGLWVYFSPLRHMRDVPTPGTAAPVDVG